MSTHIASRNPRRQRGAATLVIAMILLFGVTLVVLFTAGSTYMEIRMSANEVRARQAFAEAQGALDFAVAQMQVAGPAGGVLPGTRVPTGLSRVRFLALNAVPDDCPAAPGDLEGAEAATGARTALIYACGWSDDSSARKAVMQFVDRSPAVPNPPENPLVARGQVNVQGGMTVYNYYHRVTVWSGGQFSINSATGKTAVRHDNAPEIGMNQPPPDPPGGQGCGDPYECTSSSTLGSGLDVADCGPNGGSGCRLATLTNDEFFVNFFGTSPDAYRQRKATMEVGGGTANAELSGVTGEVIWVEGGATINTANIGTRDNPVVLIVNGDLTLSGNARIFGIVFVRGNLSGTGGPDVYGSMLVQGTTVGVSGNLKVIYDRVALIGAGGLGPTGSMPGTWRDWL